MSDGPGRPAAIGKKSVGREGIEPPQPEAADLQSAELTTLLNLPAVDAPHPILPVRAARAGDQLTMRRDRGCITSPSTSGCARSTRSAACHTPSTSASSWNAYPSPASTAAVTDG